MSATPISGLEKAAMLLKSLPASVVDKVLARMDARQANLLKAEIAKVSGRADLKESMSRVLDEAVGVLTNKNAAPTKPAAPPPQVDLRIAEEPAKQEAPPPKEPPEPADPLAALAAMSPDLLTQALESENARTIALLMNRMEVDAAGQIYKRLSPAKRKEVSLRFTDATTLSDDLLKHLARAVLKKCQTLSVANVGGGGGGEQAEREKRMAGMLRNLERADRLEMLTTLEESDAALAGRIKAMLYLFDDILRMENSSIQKLLSEIDMKSLASALFGAPPEIANRIMSNLSRRAQESLKEEIELTGKVPAAKVKQARQSLEEAMQRLDQRGEFLLME